MNQRRVILAAVLLLFSLLVGMGLWKMAGTVSTAEVRDAGTILFIRGGAGTGGFLEGGADEHLSDINEYGTDNGNHGWGQLADLLRAEGFTLEQMIEGPAENNTPIDFAGIDLAQYSVIVLGSNNADYSTASVNAIESYVRNGGGLLVISDANWGQDWGDAPTSDQEFLDRFGLVMNQDTGQYVLERSEGDFANGAHPIVQGVDAFDGEGVSPITVAASLPAGVTAEVVAQAEGNIRVNDSSGQGSVRAATEQDGALVVATVDDGRVAGHFDRNTFFNTNGAGTDLTRFDNSRYARNLFHWLAGTESGSGEGIVTGELVKWHPLTVSFAGPLAAETDDDPNPFLDYRLTVTFTGPSGQQYKVPGYFAGDGIGNGTGDVWQVRFAADEAGTWTYVASFRSGADVAVSLEAEAGTAAAFDGASGSFEVGALDPAADGFLKWGRLGYVGGHYLKFHDGDYWIKGGTDSPENFLGYAGFDNTVDQSGGASTAGLTDGIHRYPSHTADWESGDPNFVSADTGYEGKAIIGALNYLSTQQVNSIYFLPMNLGGDGRETYPFINPDGTAYGNTHYDISKLEQWNIVLDHAQRQGMALNVVLAETEAANEAWLDDGELGVERKLYYRELIARYGYLLALKWNLSEENDYSVSDLRAFADYIQALDWQNHPISVHTKPNAFGDYEQIKGEERFSATSIQYTPGTANEHVERWRAESAAAGRPWVVDMDENNPAGTGLTDDNANTLRKEVLYDVYFSGGNIEWYAGYHSLPLGGDMRLEDFRTREEMWTYMWYARRFMEENLPFWEMEPADDLLTDEDGAFDGGQVFAKAEEVYAVYLPDASQGGTLDLQGVSGTFFQRWYNPRSGSFVGSETVLTAGSEIDLGLPPADADEDWVILIRNEAGPAPTVTPSPTATPLPSGPRITELLLVNAETDEIMYRLSDGDTLNLALLPTERLNIEAVTNPYPAGSVAFNLNIGELERIESIPPFTMAGDDNGDYVGWIPDLGSYTLTATAYKLQGGMGAAGVPVTIQFTVIDDASASTATPRPTITPTPNYDEGIFVPAVRYGE